MSTAVRRTVVALVAAAGAALVIWAFLSGRREIAREREREAPVRTPARISHGPHGEPLVTIEHEAQERARIEVAALVAVERPREVDAYGVVVDPSALIAGEAALVTAEAAFSASRSELERVRRLRPGDIASRKSLEAAEASFRADESREREAARRLALEWGDLFTAATAQARDELVDSLARRSSVLVRASLPAGERLPGAPVGARVVPFDRETESLAAAHVLPAPAAAPETRGAAFFLLVTASDRKLVPGAAVTSYLALGGPPDKGVVIPRAALVRLTGKSWAYVRAGKEEFARREVLLERPTPDGWLVTEGFAPGENVVTAGAALVLSEEQKMTIPVLGEEGEEGGE